MTGFGAWWHWVIILILFVLLFGAKKLPDAARGVGRSLRILKAEVGAMSDDKKETPSAEAPPASSAPAAAPVPPVVATPVVLAPSTLSAHTVEPIQPVQPIHPAQITVNGRPVDQT